MKRVPIVLAVLLVVAICGFAAWFALAPTDPASDSGRSEDAAAVDSAGEEPGDRAAETDPGRKRVTAAPGTEGAASSNTVIGQILYEGQGVAGATIEAFAAPPGEFDERMDRAKEIFGDLFSEEELKAMEGRFGRFANRGRRGGPDRDDAGSSGGSISVSVDTAGRGGGVSVQDSDGESIDLSNLDLEGEGMQEAMGAGMEMVGRMMSDPSFLEKAMDLGRMEAAGFQRDADWPRVGAAQTDAEGRFEIASLPDGQVELRVRAPGYIRHKKRVDVGAADISIALRRGALLHGVVVSGGSPVAGAKVRTKTTTLTTDGAGSFRLDGASTPRESVLVSARGYVTAGRSVPLDHDTTADPLTIELQPAAIVRGVVIGHDGAPIPGAAVRLTKGDTGFNPMAFMELAQRDNVKAPTPSAVADENGVFEIDGIPGGSVKIGAEKRGYLSATTESFDAPPGQVTDGVELRLLRESRVTGRVLGPEGEAVAGATVKVSLEAPKGMGGMIAGMFGGAWARGTTADDGTYEVGGLTGGERKVRVESLLYLHEEVTVAVPAEDTATQDFRLRPGYTVAGIVVGPAGEPVPGARVGVKWAKAGGSNPMAAMVGGMAGPDMRVTADDAGAFAFTGLQEGPYELTASSDAYLDGSVDDVLAGATDVSVQMRSAASISGRVIDLDGNPVGGAWVHRKGGPRKAGANPWMAMFSQGPKVLTDAEGKFHLPKLEPGRYQLFSRREEYAESETTKLKVEEGEHIEGIELVLREGESLIGSVVVRGSGEPVEGALVYVTPGAMMNFNPMDAVDMEPTAPPNSISTKTDASGTFTLDGLSPGKVTVEVRHRDFAAASLARIEVPGEGVTIEIGTGGVVEGTVTDDAGNAQAGVSIILTGGAMGFGRQKTASTDANGVYRMERVVPGSYNIMKMGGNSAFGVGGMTQVVVREGETTVHDFRPERSGGNVKGGVTRDGKPVEGAMVILAGGSVGMQMTSSGSDGSFSFDGIAPGTYTVSVQADLMGGGTSAQEINIGEDGKAEDIRLELTSLSISGRVIDAETGEGVALAQVILFDGEVGTLSSLEEIMQNQRGQAITDDKGRFAIKGVAEGTFAMRVSANGYAESTHDRVAAGATDVVLKITGGVEFEVTVVGPDNEPVSGATVTARDSEGNETMSIGMAALQGATDSSGVSVLRLLPGKYTIVAESAGLPSNTAVVDASRGSVVIRLEQGGGIEVVVTKGGRPLPGARITVLDEAGNPLEKRISMGNFMGSGRSTDSAGRAVREGLPAGRLTVVVAPPEGATVKREVDVRRGATEKLTIEVD